MGGAAGQKPLHPHRDRTVALGQADCSRGKGDKGPGAEHRLDNKADGPTERDAPGEKRKGMHRVLAERHSERPRRHAVEADAPLGRHGVRLLAAEGQYVQENATADMLRHGLDTHTDRVYRRTG